MKYRKYILPISLYKWVRISCWTYLLLCVITSKCLGRDKNYNAYVLLITFNHESDIEPTIVLKDNLERYFIPTQYLLDKHIKQALLANTKIQIDGTSYVNLSLLKSVIVELEPQGLKLILNVPHDHFDATGTHLNLQSHTNATHPDIMSGGFVNYDISLSKSQFHRKQKHNAILIPDIVVFNRYGVGQHGLLIGNNQSWGKHNSPMITRLETNWTCDFPTQVKRLRIGDTISHPASWGDSIRISGIQFATNFDIQPGFISYAQPSIRGSVRLPSTIDILAKNTRVFQGTIPAGGYFIDNPPLFNGAGELTLQVRDIAGKINTTVVPYYIANTLLKEGFSDYSIELGKTRANYGYKSNDYRDAAILATYKYGVTDYLTTDLHIEALKKLQVAGITNDWLVGTLGTMGTSVAASINRHRYGYLLGFNFQRQSDFSFGARIRVNNKHFNDISSWPKDYVSKIALQGTLGYYIQNYGTVSAYYTDSRDRCRKKYNLLTVGYQNQLWDKVSLLVSASKDLANKHSLSGIISLTMSLGSDKNITYASTQQSRQYHHSIELQKNLLEETGVEYRLKTTTTKEFQGEVKSHHPNIDLSARAADVFGYKELFINAAGSAGFAGSKSFLSRNIRHCTILVNVGNFSNVRVYKDNHLIGRTAEDGNLLLHNISSYSPVNISIATEDLPMDTHIPYNTLTTYCAYKTVTYASFPAHTVRNIIMRLKNGNDQPLEAGMEVQIDGIADNFITGYNGLVFIEDLGQLQTIQGRACKQGICCKFILNDTSNTKNAEVICTY
ncbi:MAG: fimbrial biogenesis outer membrane usher protein [Proteobacteria bacterium]|nr:fimbrial biogenesis outer membrane usher protein [Pseudomonadota bacterium]